HDTNPRVFEVANELSNRVGREERRRIREDQEPVAGLLYRLVHRAGLSSTGRQIDHAHIPTLGGRQYFIRPVGGAIRDEQDLGLLLRIVQSREVLQLRGKIALLVVGGDDERYGRTLDRITRD